MRATRLSVLAAAALLASCGAREMGSVDATFAALMDRQQACREDTDSFVKPYASLQDMTDCESVASGLVSLAEDAAAAANEAGIDPRNAVFYYRRATAAAWQSHDPQALENVPVYAREGLRICETAENVQPGDCALLAVLPALARHDAAALELNRLERADFLEPVAGKDAAEQPSDTRLGAVSRRLFEAWRDVRTAGNRLCAPAVHLSLRGYVAQQEASMREDLNLAFRHADDLPDAGTTLLAEQYGTLCAEPDGGAIEVRLQDGSPTIPVAQRLRTLAWCQWQRAARVHQASPQLCPGG